MGEPEQNEVNTKEEPSGDVYEGNVYNWWITFNNCTITNLTLKQQGKPPVKDPPPGTE